MSERACFSLDAGEGHVLNLWSEGDPSGLPVLVLHGGPGAGSAALETGVFPPGCRLVGFDQRGSGRSAPAGEVHANDTQRVIGDIERVRSFFGLGRWLLYGRSWGAYLALRYARNHPEPCLGFLLFGLFLPWHESAQALFSRPVPGRAGEDYAGFIPPAERSDLLRAYGRRILGADRAQALAAAQHLTSYQNRLSRGAGGAQKSARAYPPEETLAYARIQIHYALNRYFAEERGIEQLIAPLSARPCQLVHGAADLICPPENSRRVASGWSGAVLEEVAGAPHSPLDPANRAAISSAAARLERQLA
jgi:proline iminopeptidase